MVKVQDEVGYGFYFYFVVQMFGMICEEMMDQFFSGKVKYLLIFNYFIFIWVDMGVIGWFVDGVVICNQVLLCCVFYGFYGCVMVCICKEEFFYQWQGFEIFFILMQGIDEQCVMVQDVVDCWYWLSLVMFGFFDDQFFNLVQLMQWKIKWFFNDELCQCFVSMFVFQVEIFGVILFDFELCYDEEIGCYEMGEIDWDEFFEVLCGNGFCNVECIEC